MDYAVKTSIFEGPLELLLELIEKRKLFVGDVSLAEVTDDFIRYIESHDEFPLAESAEFIVVASTLMLIKSRSLLPSLPLTEEETASIEDLENRLKLYKKTKELAAELKSLFGKRIIFEKSPRRSEVVIFSPDSMTDIGHLSIALQNLLNTLPKKEALTKATVRKVITLEESIEKLAERIKQGLKMKFSDVYKKEERINIIVGFLAMLELVKRGLLKVSQEKKHGEIEMETETATI